MLFAVYAVTAVLVLWLAHRFVVRLSRGAAVFLFLLPLAICGYPLIANRAMGPIDGSYMGPPLGVIRQQRGIGVPHNLVTTDIYTQMIPWRQVLRESVGRGEWPLWNPYILSGDILAAAAQPAPYSPFTLIALVLPAAMSFTFTASIAFLVAGLGAFAFARELGCRESTAAIGAAGWALANPMVLYVLWPLAFCWALFPLVLLAARRVVLAPGVRGGALLMVILTLLLLGGHPETVLHAVILGAVYGAIELAFVRRNALRALATAVVAGVTALLLSAIFLLPVFEALPQTAEYYWRNVLRSVDRLDTNLQVLVSLGTDFFPFLHIRGWHHPPGGGLKAETAAVGGIAVALAVYALIRARSRQTWTLGGFALFGLLAQAAWPPLMWTLHRVPGFDVTINERLGFAAACSLALLAALGAEQLLATRDFRNAALVMTCVLLVLTAGTLWITRSFDIEPIGHWGEYRVFAELGCLSLAALAVIARPRGVAIALVALLVAQRVLSEGGVHKSFAQSETFPPMHIFDPLPHVAEPFRVVGKGIALIPGTNAMYGLEDVRGYEAMTFRPYFQTYPVWSVHQTGFFNQVHDLTRPLLSMMNVRFAFASKWDGIPPGWRLLGEQGSATLLENTNVIERAFVPANVKIGPLDVDATVNEMDACPDFRKQAWITAPDVRTYERANGPGRVTALRRPRFGAYEADVAMDGDGWLIVSDSAWQGWRAYVDGRRVKIQRANLAFLSVYLTKGTHRVRLRYWPQSFVRGRMISLLTFLAVALFAFVYSRAPWREKDSSPHFSSRS
ncbi:MAG: YfhO family protein [Acidobacteria bacterium]|nr:YfhO family protein [Acidobacteriota bacterium]MBV9476106.1 YfhO family protein [Acidobacteriota bacterium]